MNNVKFEPYLITDLQNGKQEIIYRFSSTSEYINTFVNIIKEHNVDIFSVCYVAKYDKDKIVFAKPFDTQNYNCLVIARADSYIIKKILTEYFKHINYVSHLEACFDTTQNCSPTLV